MLNNIAKTKEEGEIFIRDKALEEKLRRKARKLFDFDSTENSEEKISALVYYVDRISRIIIDSYITSKQKKP